MKFSAAMSKIIKYLNTSESKSANLSSTLWAFGSIQKAYDNFIKRIVGVTNFSEIEGVIQKWSELSDSKYSLEGKDESNAKPQTVRSYSSLINEFKRQADARMRIQSQTTELKVRMQSEIDNYSKRKNEEIKNLKQIIKGLRLKVESTHLGSDSDAKMLKIKEKFKLLVAENEHLADTSLKMKDRVDDLSQKKNQLNFLVYLCMKEGCPVGKLFNQEIKPIDSHRFDLLTPSKIKSSMKKLNEEMQKLAQSKTNNSVFEPLPEEFFEDSDDLHEYSVEMATNRTIGINGSYDNIVMGPPAEQTKPSLVPSLDFQRLSDYNKAIELAKKKKIQEKLMQQ